MGDAYFLFKALHLIAMVTWFAGLFYMFRLFVYHVENREKPEVTDVFKVMERKLYRIITLPGMLATWFFGLGISGINPGLWRQPWFHAKLGLVVLLTGYTLFVGWTRRRFSEDDFRFSSKQCRLLNEVPTLFLVAIVLLAVFRYKWLS